jgi:predicted transcriptional regulator
MDLNYLNSKIDEIDIPITTIADKMGISRQSLYLKLNGRREFKTSEMRKICEILRLTVKERNRIFFADRVDKDAN